MIRYGMRHRSWSLLAFVSSFAAGACLVCFACSGSDGSVGADDASSEASSADGGKVSPGDGGCRTKSAGPQPAKVATSVARGTGAAVAWTNPPDGLEDDEKFASADLGAQETTDELRVTGFGFNLPDNARIVGVEAQLKRISPGDGGAYDGEVNLIVPNKTTRGKFLSTPWPRVIVGTHHYGASDDTWDANLTPADINDPGFGASVWAKRGADFTQTTALVDSLRILVYYCSE